MRLGFSFCPAVLVFVAGCSSGHGVSVSVGGGPNIAVAPVGTDDRPPITAPTAPPPISGGTLIVTHDGSYAVAADPDRDRISIVGVNEKVLLHTIALTPGDEPGRLVEDSSGIVHVALRRGGAVVAIDPATGTVVRRTTVCGAPRGIAFDATTKLLHVACAGGDLVSLHASGGDPVRHLQFGPDLRDVVVVPSGLVVSRFKSVSFVRLDADGNVVTDVKTIRIGRANPKLPNPGQPGAERPPNEAVSQAMDPSIAWRTVAAPNGDILSLHQYALAEVIDVRHDQSGQISGNSQSYGTPPGVAPGCGSLVSPAVSTLNSSGEMWMGAQIAGPFLAVDLSVSPDGAWVALAHAGTPDPGAIGLNPTPSFGSSAPGDGFGAPLGEVTVMNVATTAGQDPASQNCATPDVTLPIPGQTTAVAFNPDPDTARAQANGAWLVAQTREPAELVFVNDSPSHDQQVVDLAGASVLDTGHELFHRDSGDGIACAGCHAEGGEDGRVWKFKPTGDRRTQALHVGISGTEPFHWDGDMTDLGVLMDEVFVRRMGGAHQSPDRIEALKTWLSTLTPPARFGDASSPEAVRGKALFESSDVGCVSCHSGDKHTNNQNVNVGTTEATHLLQVPSLVGIGYRAPFLHNGCAATLRDRFNPACGGGDKHGKTSGLTDTQIGDLVAYLQTL